MKKASSVMGTTLILAASACAARLPERIVDPGLHRQWVVDRDSAHPGRPPRLVEVPWSSAAASPEKRAHREAPAVRAGMRVTLWWRDQATEMRLSGTALDEGRAGEAVRVRAGLHGAVLRGVVRGPVLVELELGRR